jgi:hypothetical protein
MSSYPSRNDRYYDSARQSHNGNSRLQSVNFGDDENMEGMSEDLHKIFDDDSKCSRLLKKKVLCDKRSFDIRIQEFETYLEKSDSNKVVSNIIYYFNIISVYDEISSTWPESSFRTISRTVC